MRCIRQLRRTGRALQMVLDTRIRREVGPPVVPRWPAQGQTYRREASARGSAEREMRSGWTHLGEVRDGARSGNRIDR